MSNSALQFCVTIDDNHKSIYEIAYPILSEFSVPVILFLSTSDINDKNINKAQIIEMANNGISIQSHSHSHRNHYILKRDDILNEGLKSKKIIEDITGKLVNQYAFPHGAYDKKMCQYLVEVGYTQFYSSDYGLKKSKFESFELSNRIEIFKNRNINYFLNYSTLFRRRIRIELSKLRMKYLPNSYKAKTLRSR